MILFKGKKKGIVHTMDITLSDIIAVFFPKNFREKYRYLGVVPDGKSEQVQMLKSLIIVMDNEAKPWYCPRWFLRFLHLFGSDNSIVRVRNRFLHDLQMKLTKGIVMWDYKTKWEWYDLRIHISAPKHIQDLASAIEQYVYRKGYKQDVLASIKKIEPDFAKDYLPVHKLESILEELEKKIKN